MTSGTSMGKKKASREAGLAKAPTGIRGLDEITGGGLPRGRPTLVCGGAGCGKTLLGMEFLVRGIREFEEPGVFMAFEETAEELADNVFSLGFDLRHLIAAKKLALDHVRIERSEIHETGEYDLSGLFIRLGAMISEINAKRVVLDTLEALFAGLPNEAILRAELRRLFRWLKEQGVTAVITAEQGSGTLTRHGLEEYISDCVIVLDHRVRNQIATRRLRVVKYRGSSHGTNEYPTMIDEHGLSVLPISSLGLNYPVSTQRVSSGVQQLDDMLGGGYYRGSSVLITGTAGTGKTSLAAAFADSTCRRGQRCLYSSFEESPDQIIRNMRSIGIDLAPWMRKGLLKFHAVRPTLQGLESHLVELHKLVTQVKPVAIVMDPITNLTSIAEEAEARSMLTRVIDFLKKENVTAVFTSLTAGGDAPESTTLGVSSLMDSWLLVRMIESENERNRVLYVLKSRGMAHSNQMREFLLTDSGIQFIDVYTGPGAVYTGSARVSQEARDRQAAEDAKWARERRSRDLEQERGVLQAQLEAIKAKLAGIEQEEAMTGTEEAARRERSRQEKQDLATARKSDVRG